MRSPLGAHPNCGNTSKFRIRSSISNAALTSLLPGVLVKKTLIGARKVGLLVSFRRLCKTAHALISSRSYKIILSTKKNSRNNLRKLPDHPFHYVDELMQITRLYTLDDEWPLCTDQDWVEDMLSK